MPECKHAKRLQFYLDGWTDGHGSREFEKHLKHCPECQLELAELEELGAAALEIIEQAPDKGYWDSFTTRVRNRIFSRNVSPIAVTERKAPRLLFLRLASVLTIIVALFASTYFIFQPGVIPSEGEIASLPASEPAPAVAVVSPKSETTAGKTHLPVLKPGTLDITRISPEPSSPGPARDMASEPPHVASRPESSPLPFEARDVSAQFKQATLIGPAQLKLDTEAGIHALTAEPALIDPSYRLRSSFIGQRLLAGLGMAAQNGSSSTLSGPLYGFGLSSTAFAWENFENDIASSWGYLRIASDTSRSTEIKKYFIELEIMQSR